MGHQEYHPTRLDAQQTPQCVPVSRLPSLSLLVPTLLGRTGLALRVPCTPSPCTGPPRVTSREGRRGPEEGKEVEEEGSASCPWERGGGCRGAASWRSILTKAAGAAGIGCLLSFAARRKGGGRGMGESGDQRGGSSKRDRGGDGERLRRRPAAKWLHRRA